MIDNARLEELIENVRANRKYGSISTHLIRRLSEDAISKGLSGKTAVKAVRNKLHQVGGAYFKQNMDYDEAKQILADLPHDLQDEETRQFCLKYMRTHTSTAERLPILDTFFQTCLAPIQPVTSVLDLACGMNPLALPWMPLDGDFIYQACDIYLDMLDLIGSFFAHFDLDAQTYPCDLVGKVPPQHADVAFLLKSIPCLEQVDKSIGLPLLETIRADHILVSFPVRSIGGRKKGMPDFYRDHFYEMISGKPWEIQEFEFHSELAFLVTK